MYLFSEENFLAFDAIYLYVSFHQSLIRSGYKMRVYVLRLFMISIYSFLSATIIICMLMVSIPTDLQKHIRNDLNLMIFQDTIVHSSLKTVLLDLRHRQISEDDIWNYTKCQQKGIKSKRKTIVLVPYRDRLTHLKFFISPLHEHLMNQVIHTFLSNVVKNNMRQMNLVRFFRIFINN